MNDLLYKALATFAAAIPCTYMLHLTKGEHGIGWFIVALLFIW